MLKKYLVMGSLAFLGFNLGVDMTTPSLDDEGVRIESQSHAFNLHDDENYNHVLGHIDQGIYAPLDRGIQ